MRKAALVAAFVVYTLSFTFLTTLWPNSVAFWEQL
jgi:hypothetical protein